MNAAYTLVPGFADIRTDDRMRLRTLITGCGGCELYYGSGMLQYCVPVDRDAADALEVVIPLQLIFTDDRTPYRLVKHETWYESQGAEANRQPGSSSHPWKYISFRLDT